MQKDGIQPSGPDWRCRTAIFRVRSDAHCPLAIAARAAHNRQLQRIGSGGRRGKEILHGNDAFAGGRANQRNRRPQLARQGQHVDMAALLAQFVGHVQQHQRGKAERDDARRQHQVRVQIGGIQHQDDRVRTRRSRHVAVQNVDCDLLVFGFWNEAVDAGQIDQRDLFAVRVANVAGVMLDGDAREIADLLTQLGETIE